MSADLSRALEAMGIRDPAVLRAVAEVPRELFVPPDLRGSADADHPLPIGFGQTISQPFVVAYMTEQLRLGGRERVLEVGTGSGYQTALLARLAAEVFSIEIVPALAERAREVLLGTLGLQNLRLRTGDGGAGWPEAAPFERILVTAAAPEVPPALVAQLAPGGRMVIPVGEAPDLQVLRAVDKGNDGANVWTDLIPVRFVPLTGAAG
ncbi:protein-L-isoaspartate(D-aspartate) O-methyltransferase [Anaeromyxobacter sp. SG66]|uniref:protein-L-isoaspartate(D-aspartate) O-methyltransferase n=1 Tax=Anaeromyxobacter sp. SG66 TaxID=2925410 RepID=UPI0027DEEC44|nr:protein-L-isoaspartate(D-aspartate) O-methyltransferase [Anaeromyxobacter sp. SG66]